MFDNHAFFEEVNDFLLNLIAILNLCNLISFKQLKFFKFVEILFFFLVDELNEFEIFDDGHIDKEAI
jgi:hypothetical protein